jgi:hypothetical protein
MEGKTLKFRPIASLPNSHGTDHWLEKLEQEFLDKGNQLKYFVAYEKKCRGCHDNRKCVCVCGAASN